MTIVESLAPLAGTWKGVNRLRLMPTDEFRESEASATVAVTAKDYITVAYTWSEDGQPQNGLLLVSEAGAVWVDSWHSSPQWLLLDREPDGGDGEIRLAGTYATDWGWRIHLQPAAARIVMFNAPPGHDPYDVVEISLSA